VQRVTGVSVLCNDFLPQYGKRRKIFRRLGIRRKVKSLHYRDPENRTKSRTSCEATRFSTTL
jgi:hypothetical protein